MDFSGIKAITIPQGDVKMLHINGTLMWQVEATPTYTNQVPISEDTTAGSIFNDVGYIENKRLSSSGSLSSSAQNGSVTTGFIPFPNGDKTVIRIKGVEWLDAKSIKDGHYYILFYGADKKVLTQGTYISSGGWDGFSHVMNATKDANGVQTVTFNQTYGTSNSWLQAVRNNAKYIRITAYGKGADFIVTIDEEIK